MQHLIKMPYTLDLLPSGRWARGGASKKGFCCVDKKLNLESQFFRKYIKYILCTF